MEGTFVVKSGLAQMCKGGLIMDVVNAEQAKIAEEAGVSLEECFKMKRSERLDRS
jgi:pyridoxal biosynthesis lyase PdxS